MKAPPQHMAEPAVGKEQVVGFHHRGQGDRSKHGLHTLPEPLEVLPQTQA